MEAHTLRDEVLGERLDDFEYLVDMEQPDAVPHFHHEASHDHHDHHIHEVHECGADCPEHDMGTITVHESAACCDDPHHHGHEHHQDEAHRESHDHHIHVHHEAACCDDPHHHHETHEHESSKIHVAETCVGCDDPAHSHVTHKHHEHEPQGDVHAQEEHPTSAQDLTQYIQERIKQEPVREDHIVERIKEQSDDFQGTAEIIVERVTEKTAEKPDMIAAAVTTEPVIQPETQADTKEESSEMEPEPIVGISSEATLDTVTTTSMSHDINELHIPIDESELDEPSMSDTSSESLETQAAVYDEARLPEVSIEQTLAGVEDDTIEDFVPGAFESVQLRESVIETPVEILQAVEAVMQKVQVYALEQVVAEPVLVEEVIEQLRLLRAASQEPAVQARQILEVYQRLHDLLQYLGLGHLQEYIEAQIEIHGLDFLDALLFELLGSTTQTTRVTPFVHHMTITQQSAFDASLFGRFIVAIFARATLASKQVVLV